MQSDTHYGPPMEQVLFNRLHRQRRHSDDLAALPESQLTRSARLVRDRAAQGSITKEL